MGLIQVCKICPCLWILEHVNLHVKVLQLQNEVNFYTMLTDELDSLSKNYDFYSMAMHYSEGSEFSFAFNLFPCFSLPHSLSLWCVCFN